MRSIVREIEIPTSIDQTFELLCRPSAIRQWWGAARAIVHREQGGLWIAAWGENEDEPDYVSAARLLVYEPPHRMVMGDFEYHAREEGPLPFEAEMVTEYVIEPNSGGGSRLRVRQWGFPDDPSADDFYAGCETEWDRTLENLQRFASSLD